MGTRSIVTFVNEWDGEEICAVYRQYDGYPEVRGRELANFLEGYKVGNGIQMGVDDLPGIKYANGMGELAAHWIVNEKSEHMSGNVYIERGGWRSDDLQWIYEVRAGEGGVPQVKVIDVYGVKEFPSIKDAIAFFGEEL